MGLDWAIGAWWRTMEGVRRWWDRYAFQVLVAVVALLLAIALRYTNGVLWMEIYQLLSRPWQAVTNGQTVLEEARVRELQYRLQELEVQNQQLRQMLALPPILPTQSTWAQIIGRSADAWWQQVIISKGSRDGIALGAIVTGAGGLVGRVIATSPHSSRVLLISDPSSTVGVVVSRSRALGLLRGQSQSRGILEFLDRDPDAKVGDIITTSPFSTLYPEGIPVGRIRSINLNKQPAPEAVVDFSAPLAILEFVKVYAPPQE